LFRQNHKQGVLFLGLTIIFGIVGFLAFQVGIEGAFIFWPPFDLKIPIFAGNPILLVVLILHFIISHRYYDGILAKKYWQLVNDPKWIWRIKTNRAVSIQSLDPLAFIRYCLYIGLDKYYFSISEDTLNVFTDATKRP
jgi:hypothetical protein